MQKGIKWAIHKGNEAIKEGSLVAVLKKESSGTNIVSFVLNDEKVLRISGQKANINYKSIRNGVPDLMWKKTGLDQKTAKKYYEMILEYVKENGYN